MIPITDPGSICENDNTDNQVMRVESAPLMGSNQKQQQEIYCSGHHGQHISNACNGEMDGPHCNLVEEQEMGKNLKPFASTLESFASLTITREYVQKEDEDPPKSTLLIGAKQDDQEYIRKTLRQSVYQAVVQLKRNSRAQMGVGSQPPNEKANKLPKCYGVPEDNDDAKKLSSNGKTRRSKAKLVGVMVTSFELPEDFLVNGVDLDKLTVPACLLERLKAEAKYERRFTFSERQKDWTIERKLRSNGRICDTYFFHRISNELVRSVAEVVNFIMYEIHPNHLTKTIKGASKEDKPSMSIVLMKTIKGASKEDKPSGSRSFKRTRGQKLSTIHSPEGFVHKEHESHVVEMEFSVESHEIQSSKKDTEPLPSNSSEAVDSLARKLDRILCSFFKEVNMLDLYIASRKQVREDDTAELICYETVDDLLAQEVAAILYSFFARENMLDVYLASKRMTTEDEGSIPADSMKAMADDSAASRKLDEILHRLFEEVNFQDLVFPSKKMGTEVTEISYQSTENMVDDNSLDSELDASLHHFLKEADLLDVYLESQMMNIKEAKENDQNSVAPSPNSISATSEEVNQVVAPSSVHVTTKFEEGESSVTQTLDATPDVYLVEENKNTLPVPEAVNIVQGHNNMLPIPEAANIFEDYNMLPIPEAANIFEDYNMLAAPEVIIPDTLGWQNFYEYAGEYFGLYF